MKTSEMFLAEMKAEAVSTRKLLALVPFEKGDYKPHEKSMSMLKLATHVAEITGWWKETLSFDELDFAKGGGTPNVYNSTEDILAKHDDLVAKAEVILSEIKEEEFDKNWTMRNGDYIILTAPKREVARTWCLNHLYHHRAQLSVYLRLLDIPIPGMYGPTADV